MYPTTAGAVEIIAIFTINNVTASSATGIGGTWNNCSGCHSTVAGVINVDALVNTTGTGGNTSYNVNLSGASQNTSCPAYPGCFFYVEYVELLPPAGQSVSLDVSGSTTNNPCSTTCNGVALTTTATDAVVQITSAPDTFALAGPFTFSGAYQATGTGAGLILNSVTGSISAPTFGLDSQSHGGSGPVGVVALAFKSGAGTFAVSNKYSMVNYTATWTLNSNTTVTCSPACPAFTIPSTTSGNLLYIQTSDSSGKTLSSVSDGTNTWTVPAGCNITNAVGSLSCGYVLSTAAGITSVTPTMSGTSPNVAFVVTELHRTAGSWVLDADACTANGTSTVVPGQALSLTGGNDVIFQSSEIGGGPDGFTLYPFAFINKGNGPFGGGYTFANNYSDLGVLLNTNNGSAPTGNGPSNPSNVCAVAFK